MQDKVIQYVLSVLLKNLDVTVAAKFLVGLLRAIVKLAKEVALRDGKTDWKDDLADKLSVIVEDIAKALHVA